MRRTRKWSYVAQEAQRLADLGLSPKDIAERLEVRKSTVTRWMASGKLTRKGATPAEKRKLATVAAATTPAQWSAAVRDGYDLDATDAQLVELAESTLLLIRDPQTPAHLRIQAMGRFQSLVKQLALVAKAADADKADEAPKRKAFVAPARTGTDPRDILTRVK